MDAASVDGTWDITVMSSLGDRSGTLVLTSDGQQLSGTYTDPQGAQEIAGGRIDGNLVMWTFIYPTETTPMTVEFEGRIEGDRLTGDVVFGEQGDGIITGTRTSG